jgi:hypothetical protein
MTVASSDRRKSARQGARTNRACLEWSEGGEIRESAARLVDVGQGGALFLTESPPPLHQTVWCRLEGPAPTDWVPAKVVRHRGEHEVALAFADACRLDFTLAATLGLNFDSLFCVPR